MKIVRIPNFGEPLRNLRTDRKITQKQLSRKCLINRAYISLLENDVKRPKIGMVFIIADGLGMKASEIIKEVEDTL